VRLDYWRIAGQGAVQVQAAQQVLEGGDGVGLGRELDLAAEELGPGGQGAEELKALEVEAQSLGSQIGRLAFGPEQNQAGVARQQMSSGLALNVGPADPGIAGPRMESGAGPTHGWPSARP
jgi:hypothetical protein